ncbi:hypothetical protein C7B77_20010 [Chamaesiphon polymorphus CCALA 037]|uniref:Tc1-like transposase DDE domain-containing protein n=2 Tax=Chamaesiphon TaxID=217161 RepID=A0A2T1G6N6_9CYAN|nr:hypothetical protein C7B77_20010 [Chamaesiphon polymorphus CCALA 037]
MTRRYGRGEGGVRVYDDCPGDCCRRRQAVRGKNLTLIGAMSDEGLIATMTLTGGLDTASFLVYIKRILLPQLWVGAIVVMDNLPVHHAQRAEDLIKSVGAKVKFLPPYSPDLSPIELCWSKLKEILRFLGARTADSLDCCRRRQAVRAIAIAIENITDDNTLSWFHHCGLYLEKIR